MRSKLIYASVFLLSASALAYEILLMRLFSIIQWHHFAYMIIGLALLGYGISGTVISFLQERLLRHFELVYSLSVFLFAVTSVWGFVGVQIIPFNAEEILWNPIQLLYLAGLFLLLSFPFFFAASAICLTFLRFRKQTATIYAADLVGAGVGSLAIVFLLFWLFPVKALLFLALPTILAVVLTLPLLNPVHRKMMTTCLTLFALSLFFGWQNIALNPSPYKALQQSLLIDGARIIDRRSSPLGLLHTVENERVPFRHAPGLSLNSPLDTLSQKAIFTDAGQMSIVTRYPQSIDRLAYLDFLPSSLPFHLTDLDSMLIVGGAGGQDILQSLYHKIQDIHVLELNPQIVEVVNDELSVFSGRLYSHPEVTVHIRELRDYLGSTDKRFPLIQISLLDSFNAASSGLYALHESFLYTTEAMTLYLNHLEEDGYLALTRWINLPPRDSLKLLNTARQALLQLGITDAGERMVLIRGWQTSTLLIKNGIFKQPELAAIKGFCKDRSFDVAWMPGLKPGETNRYNQLASPLFFQAATALFSERAEDFLQDYKFDLTPATDDRPYFHHFFRWQTFNELLTLRDQGSMPLMEWGYLILWATLMIALLSSAVLILLPLFFFRNKTAQTSDGVARHNVVLYFFSIGLAFLMIEIAFIQKLTLLLHHPIYSIAFTLSTFLIFAGLGSLSSQRLQQVVTRKRLLQVSVTGISILSLIYIVAANPIFSQIGDWAMASRILLSALIISPLAFLMGLPFPIGLSSLSQHARHYIAWAWGINGFASVISASLTTILAIALGFNAVMVIALVLYLCSTLVFPEPGLKSRNGF